ncbi:MAG: HEAT repeat domain-containing protein, partial [Chloroflexi bacterium]|nr:HEAT repeat domain-containing protein [Chloroflexota bacterium]
MNLEDLLNGLKADDASARLQAARIIGLLDETLALDALAARYRVETAAEVKAAIAWAGKRVQAARQAGYTTLDAIFKHFHIEYEIENQEDKREADLLRKMQTDLDMQLLRERSGRAGNIALGAAIGGVLMGPQGMLIGAMSGLTPGADALSSGLEERPQIGKRRVLPTRPGDGDIRLIVRRLLDDPNPDKRRSAALDLGSISNNPAALPYLAQAFVEDAVQVVREAAGRAGKLIYWNVIYWEMEQSGEMAREIERRAAARSAAEAQTPAAQPTDTPAA